MHSYACSWAHSLAPPTGQICSPHPRRRRLRYGGGGEAALVLEAFSSGVPRERECVRVSPSTGERLTTVLLNINSYSFVYLPALFHVHLGLGVRIGPLVISNAAFKSEETYQQIKLNTQHLSTQKTSSGDTLFYSFSVIWQSDDSMIFNS